MNQGCFQQSFTEEPTLSERLFDLLETTFPGISKTAQSIRELGTSWEGASTPFIYFLNDLAIAHVGVLEIPMLLMGQPVTVGGIHGVCTRPEFRRCGYYRSCMEAALNYCDSCYETLILTTAQPELYLPFGFRVIEEHAFVNQCVSTDYTEGFRVLNLQTSSDRKMLHRLLDEREPVSNIVGVISEKAVFCFNEGNRPLHYAEDLDTIVVMEIEGKQLKLFDIVGKELCSLASILERLPQPINEVVLYFSPDRFDINAQPFPHRLEGDSQLMVRGSFAAEAQAFMLPHSARC